jgi:hypothetical protein
MTFNINHQYIDRLTGQVKNEDLFSDSCIRLIYSDIRERSPWLFHALTSTRMNQLLAFINYDMFLGQKITGADAIIRKIKFQSPEWVEEENYIRLHENYLNDKFNTGFIVRCQTVIIALFLRRMPECLQDL